MSLVEQFSSSLKYMRIPSPPLAVSRVRATTPLSSSNHCCATERSLVKGGTIASGRDSKVLNLLEARATCSGLFKQLRMGAPFIVMGMSDAPQFTTTSSGLGLYRRRLSSVNKTLPPRLAAIARADALPCLYGYTRIRPVISFPYKR